MGVSHSFPVFCLIFPAHLLRSDRVEKMKIAEKAKANAIETAKVKVKGATQAMVDVVTPNDGSSWKTDVLEGRKKKKTDTQDENAGVTRSSGQIVDGQAEKLSSVQEITPEERERGRNEAPVTALTTAAGPGGDGTVQPETPVVEERVAKAGTPEPA